MPKPWITGPVELLHHAAEHLSAGSAFDHRMAFISIDNAVEVTIRTYLGLPRRARGTDGPSRKQLSEAAGSFPDLLDLLEKHAGSKIAGIELADIEWFHRIRNTLYHEGNGVTVSREDVDSYFQIAKLLFEQLFDEKLPEKESQPHTAIGEIIVTSAKMQQALNRLYQSIDTEHSDRPPNAKQALAALVNANVLSQSDADKILAAAHVRNNAAHSAGKIDLGEVQKANKTLSYFLAAMEPGHGSV